MEDVPTRGKILLKHSDGAGDPAFILRDRLKPHVLGEVACSFGLLGLRRIGADLLK
ncbi:hypothetical protein D9M70_535850 [compost metagenome]